MSWLAWTLIFLGAGCLLFAIACQLDAMEIRYEARLRDLAEQWEANQRGSAKVVDFKQWQKRQNNQRGAA